MPAARSLLFALAVFAIAPAGVFAQGSITGVVKDTSGAVLPGVSVGATGPALLAARSVETDTSGIYRIIDLPPGKYAVTFTLSGFTTVVQ